MKTKSFNAGPVLQKIIAKKAKMAKKLSVETHAQKCLSVNIDSVIHHVYNLLFVVLPNQIKLPKAHTFFSEKASGEEEITYACGTGKEECAKADLGPLGKTEACICTKSLCNASPDRRAISAIAIILAAISISFI